MVDPSPGLAHIRFKDAPLIRLRHWGRHVVGFDRAVGFSVLGRFWSSAAGLVTVALIARFLSSVEQGYYYTFGSLVALQIVFRARVLVCDSADGQPRAGSVNNLSPIRGRRRSDSACTAASMIFRNRCAGIRLPLC